MNLGAIMGLDCRLPEHRRQLQHALSHLKPLKSKARHYFESKEDVPSELLSGLLEAIVRKYDVDVNYGVRATRTGCIWTATLSCGGKPCGTVYGCSMYEMLAKLCCLSVHRAEERYFDIRR
jgi:hypothetical protein